MWKDIVGYEGIYKISDEAEVMYVKTGLIKKPWINNKGYLCVDLSKNGITTHKLLHRLLAEAFIPNPNNYPIVLHLDTVKTNLSLDNLKWGTYSDNQRQAIQDGISIIPKPDNRKHFIITNGYESIWCYGQDMVSNNIGYGNTQTVHNLVHRHSKINQGIYKGYYVERAQPRIMCKIVKR